MAFNLAELNISKRKQSRDKFYSFVKTALDGFFTYKWSWKKYYDCNKSSYHHIWSQHSRNPGEQTKCPSHWLAAAFTKLDHPVGSRAMSRPDPTTSLSMVGSGLILLHFKDSLDELFLDFRQEARKLALSHTESSLPGHVPPFPVWTSVFSCIKWASRPVNQRSAAPNFTSTEEV